jgi:hypothetical protein
MKRTNCILVICLLPSLVWVMVSSFLVVLDFWFVLQLILERSRMGEWDCTAAKRSFGRT